MAVKFALFSVACAEQPSFEDWAAQYGVNAHDSSVKRTYEAKVVMIEASNKRHTEFTLGVNQFSGYTESEFQEMFTGEVDHDEDIPTERVEVDEENDVTAVDWSTRKDLMNPVKNQGSCGSCWAFAATGVLEPTYAIATGTLFDLSEQQLLDCDKDSPQSGCKGGGSRYSFNDYYNTHGACATASYSYTGKDDGTCQDTSCTPVIKIGTVLGYNEVAASVSALKAQLVNGPLKVSVFADDAFSQYESGIISGGSCKGKTNHAVVAVGYGPGFIKLRNSWGIDTWGEAGYARVSDKSSCATGSFDMFAKTPIWPKLSTTPPSPPTPPKWCHGKISSVKFRCEAGTRCCGSHTLTPSCIYYEYNTCCEGNGVAVVCAKGQKCHNPKFGLPTCLALESVNSTEIAV